MSDTFNAPAGLDPVPAPTTPGGMESAPPANVANNLNSVLKSAPELGASPGLAVGVAASGGNPSARAQAVARGTNAIADSNAAQRVSDSAGEDITNALNWFGNHVVSAVGQAGSDALGGLKRAGSDVLNTMNKPMQVVQHEYRYLHQVEATKGRGVALLEGLGIAAGAAGGFALGGGYGAVLGAELAGGAESQVYDRNAWQATASASYEDPHTHQQVSLGRDIVSFLDSHGVDLGRQGTTPYRLTSGLIDGLFDLNIGGGEVLGLVKEAKSAEGLEGFLGSRWGGTAVRTVGDAVGGAGITDPDEIDRIVAQYRSVRNAFADIAGKTSEEILATPAYAPFRQIIDPLGRASTVDEVGQVFKGVLRTQEIAFTDRLPSLSWTRLAFGQNLREAVGRALPIEVERQGLHPIQRAMAVVHPANMLQRLSPLPTSFDDAAHEIRMDSFDPASRTDDGTLGIYRMARFTEDEPTAASIAMAYHNAPSLGDKIIVYRNLTLNTLFSMAGLRGYVTDDLLAGVHEGKGRYLADFVDPEDRQALSKALDDAIGGGMFGKEAWYGVSDDPAGANLSSVRDQNGDWQYGAAIWKNQTGRLQFLDLAEARRAAARLAGAKDILGRLDDIGYQKITQGFFKPLVLLTPSYAMHIALAELIPNALREGVVNLVKSSVANNIAKLGRDIGDSEADDGAKVSAIAGLAFHIVTAGMDRLPIRMTDDLERRIENQAVLLDATGGDKVAPGVASSHAYQAEVAREDQSVSLLRRTYFDSPMKGSKTFGTIGNGNSQFIPAWQAAIREVATDETGQMAARELLAGARRGEPLEEASGNAARTVAQHMREHPDDHDWALRANPDITSAVNGFSRPPDWDNYDEWAHVKVKALRGVVRGPDGTTNASLLGKIAEGETPSRAELEAIPEESRPVVVKAREMVPDTSGKIQQIANWGFERVLNPMVNFLSRQPIAANEWDRQWEIVKPLVDGGVMDYDEAMNVALDRMTSRVMRNVHNLTDRTQWTVTLRNWAPFYFAQEQAYRRMGRLLAEDPRAFRQYQLMISNIGNVGQIFQGKDNENYFVLPGTGWMTSGVAEAAQMVGLPVSGSAPVGMGWNLSASSVIFPLSAGVRPDLSPLVSLPVDAIAKLFPETLSPVLKSDATSAANTILGPDAVESMFEQMIPNTIAQRIATAFGLDQRTLDSTVMQTMQMLDYEGKIPNPQEALNNPIKMQQFIDRVTNQSRIMYIMKAIVGGITPVSPEIQVKNLGLPQELQNDIDAQNSVIKGTTIFLQKNPDATPLTVFQSDNLEGVSIPSSVAAEKWIDDNMGMIRQYGAAALMLIPPNTSTTYNSAVYNQQIAQGFRVKYTPGAEIPDSGGSELIGYMRQLYVQAGDSIVLDKWYPQYEKELAAAGGSSTSEGYQIEQNFYGDGSQGSGTLGKYGQQNPVWWENWSAGLKDTERGAAITQMKALLASPEAPHSEIADMTRTLLQAYDAYENQIQVGTQDGFVNQSQSSIDNEWKNKLYAAVEAYPEISNVVNGLFLSLPQANSQTSTAQPVNNQPGTFRAKSWNQAA